MRLCPNLCELKPSKLRLLRTSAAGVLQVRSPSPDRLLLLRESWPVLLSNCRTHRSKDLTDSLAVRLQTRELREVPPHRQRCCDSTVDHEQLGVADKRLQLRRHRWLPKRARY